MNVKNFLNENLYEFKNNFYKNIILNSCKFEF